MSIKKFNSRLPEILERRESEILNDWLKQQLEAQTLRRDLISESDLREQSRRFLQVFRKALQTNEDWSVDGAAWADARGLLDDISRARSRQGFTPTETATFVFSLKQPIFDVLQNEIQDGAMFLNEIWATSALLDKLGLYTTESFQRSRENIIARQQQEMLELSTPVVKLWDNVLALPLIGTLDSARTQVVMENLLEQIVATNSSIAIIDITGVPLVDTLVAQHLLKTVAAARLMGAECLISGIRPQIAQTIVHLGVDLQNVVTKATLADAFLIALQRTGQMVVKVRRTERPHIEADER